MKIENKFPNQPPIRVSERQPERGRRGWGGVGGIQCDEREMADRGVEWRKGKRTRVRN